MPIKRPPLAGLDQLSTHTLPANVVPVWLYSNRLGSPFLKGIGRRGLEELAALRIAECRRRAFVAIATSRITP